MGINEMSSQQLTTFVYDPSGREIEKWLDNETRAVTSYDAAGQPLVVSNLESDNSVISRFTYTYDPIGNRAQEVRDEGTTTLTWSYDATSQLTNETRTDNRRLDPRLHTCRSWIPCLQQNA